MDGASQSYQPLPRGPSGLASLYLNLSSPASRCRTMTGGMRETDHCPAGRGTHWPSNLVLEVTSKQGLGARACDNPFSCRIQYPTESAS